VLFQDSPKIRADSRKFHGHTQRTLSMATRLRHEVMDLNTRPCSLPFPPTVATMSDSDITSGYYPYAVHNTVISGCRLAGLSVLLGARTVVQNSLLSGSATSGLYCDCDSHSSMTVSKSVCSMDNCVLTSNRRSDIELSTARVTKTLKRKAGEDDSVTKTLKRKTEEDSVETEVKVEVQAGAETKQHPSGVALLSKEESISPPFVDSSYMVMVQRCSYNTIRVTCDS